jgi:lipoyl-dependent peroxiredoxin
MALTRKARAWWEGGLADGHGEATLDSGVAGPLPVSWNARTEDAGAATSPEELIAAAHASCYAMAFSLELANAGATPRRLETAADCTFGPVEGGFAITGIVLRVRGTVDGIDAAGFAAAAEAAKLGCPVSQALAGNVPITLEATLAG